MCISLWLFYIFWSQRDCIVVRFPTRHDEHSELDDRVLRITLSVFQSLHVLCPQIPFPKQAEMCSHLTNTMVSSQQSKNMRVALPTKILRPVKTSIESTGPPLEYRVDLFIATPSDCK